MNKILLSAVSILILSFLSTTAFAQQQKPYFKNVAFGKGITHINKDSTFKIKFHFRMQHLFTAGLDEESGIASSQFLIRRSRLKFGGYVLNPNIQYKVEMGLSNRDLAIDKEDGNTRDAGRLILDAVLKWKFSKNWALWVGQTKLPGNRERLVSSANLQFVDRSLLNSKYTIDRDAGFQLRGKFKSGNIVLKPAIALSQGEGRNITSPNFGGHDYTLHLDILPFGAFTNKGDLILSDLEREPSPKLAIGLTYDYNDRAVRQGGQLGKFVLDQEGNYVENSLKTFFADLLFKYRGFSLLSEYADKSGESHMSDIAGRAFSNDFLTGTGISAQAGYLFRNNVELAFRFTNIRRDDSFSSISDEDQYTFAISKYIVGHSLKVQGDMTRRSFPGKPHGRYLFRMQVEMQF